jgi:hypothetical protein
MRYATWKLVLDETIGELTGPEQIVIDQEFFIAPLCSVGSLDNHEILGQFSDNNENLSKWQFNEVSKSAAIQIYSDNFTETPAEPESKRPAFTLDIAIASIFQNS